MKNLIRKLERSHEFWVIVGLLFSFFLLRIPSLFEPYWYGDEGIYETIGLALTKGRVLYTQIWDNKPPLLYVTYALVHSNQFLVRSLALVVGLLTVIIFYLLAKKLFISRLAAGTATGFFALLFGIPAFEGNIANAENFMLFPIILAGFFIYGIATKSSRTKIFNTKSLIITGVLLGIAFLYKIVAIFDFAAFFIFLAITTFEGSLSLKTLISYSKKFWRSYVLFIICFITPFFLSVLYFLLVGGLGEYIHAVFQSTVGYVGYKNAFIIPQGLLISKVLLLGVFILILTVKRQKISSTTLFILLWTSFSLFNCFFSQRPYTHYLLVLIPSFSLLVGQLISKRKTAFIPYLGIVLLISFSTIKYFDHWSVKGTINYYKNFVSFVTGGKSLNDYDAFFDKKTVRDSEIVNYINSHKKSSASLFIWGNTAQIYPQTGTLPPGRFTVAYHISGIPLYEEEIKKALIKNPPQFIVIMDDVSNYPYSMYNYSQVLRIQNATIYERTH
jgi:4-amino-4-deoxy-L-arabinose transferase-like glycosyltransferase